MNEETIFTKGITKIEWRCGTIQKKKEFRPRWCRQTQKSQNGGQVPVKLAAWTNESFKPTKKDFRPNRA
jgi:hypothetical protein